MHSDLVIPIPLVSLQPTETVQAAAGGAGPSRVEKFLTFPNEHPWMSWDVMQGVIVIKKCSKEDRGVDFSYQDQGISDPSKGQDNRDPSYAFGGDADEGQEISNLGEGRDKSDPIEGRGNRNPTCAFGAYAGEGRDNSDPVEGQGHRDPTCAFEVGAGDGQDNSDPAQLVAA
jgi:hypothetical protein